MERAKELVKANISPAHVPQDIRYAYFIGKQIQRYVPAHRQERAFQLAQKFYPSSDVTRINIFIAILFPTGIYMFLKAKGKIDRQKRDLMMRRREIEEEIRLEIIKEKENGTFIGWEEYQKQQTFPRMLKFWQHV